MNRRLLTLAIVGIVGAAAGCLDDSITGTRPLSFTFTADQTTINALDVVRFDYTATGTQIVGVVADYGDGVADTAQAGGGTVSTGGTFEHSFLAPGSFVVTGQVQAANGTLTETITITVN
jgi:PKD repeat protein